MTGWMILWTAVLGVTTIGFAGLLVVVGIGAIADLRQMLVELREDVNAARTTTPRRPPEPE